MIENLVKEIKKENENIIIDNEVFAYGLKSIILKIISFIIVVVIGMLLNMVLESIVFFTSFIAVRMYTGGYHSKKPILCYFLSIIILITSLILAKYISIYHSHSMILLMLLTSLLVIYALGPVDTCNKRLSKTEKRLYKKKAIRNIIIECILIYIFIFLHQYTYAYVIILGITLSAILIILGVIAEKTYS